MFYNLQIFSIAVATVKILSTVKRKKITDLSGVLVLNWNYLRTCVILTKLLNFRTTKYLAESLGFIVLCKAMSDIFKT